MDRQKERYKDRERKKENSAHVDLGMHLSYNLLKYYRYWLFKYMGIGFITGHYIHCVLIQIIIYPGFCSRFLFWLIMNERC